jgi:hypothetical protein
MGKKPEQLAELLLQIAIEEGERYDEAYEDWRRGFDFPSEKSKVEPESTPPPAVIAPPPMVEAAESRVIGEKDRRRVSRGAGGKPAKSAYREKGSGFN